MRTRHKFCVAIGVETNKGKILYDGLAKIRAENAIHALIRAIKQLANIPPNNNNKWSWFVYQNHKQGSPHYKDCKWRLKAFYDVATIDPYLTFRHMDWVGSNGSFKFVLKPCRQ
jgi:hypothetical protein